MRLVAAPVPVPESDRNRPPTRRTGDIDHTIPFVKPDDGGPPGQTGVGKLGPITRFHHRVKTHGDWQVVQPFTGVFVWRTPNGRYLLVDHTGTHQALPALPSRCRLPETCLLGCSISTGSISRGWDRPGGSSCQGMIGPQNNGSSEMSVMPAEYNAPVTRVRRWAAYVST